MGGVRQVLCLRVEASSVSRVVQAEGNSLWGRPSHMTLISVKGMAVLHSGVDVRVEIFRPRGVRRRVTGSRNKELHSILSYSSTRRYFTCLGNGKDIR